MAGQRHRLVQAQLQPIDGRRQHAARQPFAQQRGQLRRVARRLAEFDAQPRRRLGLAAAGLMLQPQAEGRRRQPLVRQPAGQRLQQALRGVVQQGCVVGALHQIERLRKCARRLEPGLRVGRVAVGAVEQRQQLGPAAPLQARARQRAHVAQRAAADAVQQLGQRRRGRGQRQRIEPALRLRRRGGTRSARGRAARQQRRGRGGGRDAQARVELQRVDAAAQAAQQRRQAAEQAQRGLHLQLEQLRLDHQLRRVARGGQRQHLHQLVFARRVARQRQQRRQQRQRRCQRHARHHAGRRGRRVGQQHHARVPCVLVHHAARQRVRAGGHRFKRQPRQVQGEPQHGAREQPAAPGRRWAAGTAAAAPPAPGRGA